MLHFPHPLDMESQSRSHSDQFSLSCYFASQTCCHPLCSLVCSGEPVVRSSAEEESRHVNLQQARAHAPLLPTATSSSGDYSTNAERMLTNAGTRTSTRRDSPGGRLTP